MRRRARGMTLIEVMIALLVTTVALLGALATVGVTLRGTSFSRNATEASVLAQSKLEELVSLPSSAVTTALIPNGTVGSDLVDGNGTGPTAAVPIPPYTRTWTWGSTSVPDALRRTITVKVEWTDSLTTHRVTASRFKVSD